MFWWKYCLQCEDRTDVPPGPRVGTVVHYSRLPALHVHRRGSSGRDVGKSRARRAAREGRGRSGNSSSARGPADSPSRTRPALSLDPSSPGYTPAERRDEQEREPQPAPSPALLKHNISRTEENQPLESRWTDSLFRGHPAVCETSVSRRER